MFIKFYLQINVIISLTMFIKSIELKNFRNYKDLTIEFSSNKILLIGKNAQGKTNLLESLYYLSCLNSARAKTDS